MSGNWQFSCSSSCYNILNNTIHIWIKKYRKNESSKTLPKVEKVEIDRNKVLKNFKK